MRIHAVLLALVLLAVPACAPPSQHDGARFGRVALTWSSGDWASSYRGVFAGSLPFAERLGPDVAFVATVAGDPLGVTVAHWESPSCRTSAAAYWDEPARTIRIDPVCASGELMLQATLLHELGHALGMMHICRVDREVPDGCSAVGLGIAVMNPSLLFGDDMGPGAGEAYTGLVPQVTYTELDLAEFRRVHP